MKQDSPRRRLRTAATRFTVLGAAGLMLAGGLALGAGSAAAETPVAPTVPVMIVLDASGSMKQDDAPGIRMDAAKTAVTNLIGTLPSDSTVGLMVYGTNTGSSDAEKAVGCSDITTLSPVGPLDVSAMSAQVATVQASGYTPIGSALRAAADALPNEGPRSIVLVSDGEDTCAPPAPCDVAAELKQQGVDLTVHTVGFKVDATAREQLTCIADATGGTFADATDAGQLEQALKVKVDYALSGYTSMGTPVAGDPQPSQQAPLLTPGQYVDTYDLGEVDAGDAGPGRNGTTKYYTIPVKEGFRPYISATLIPPDSVTKEQLGVDTMGIDLSLLTLDSTECADSRGYVVNGSDRLRPSVTVMSGPTVGGPSYGSKCNTEGVQILEVARFGDLLTDVPMTVELVVRIEPPADASKVPAAAADRSEALPTPVHGPATPVSGGRSFNDAADLISGSTYSDSVANGESRYYKFPVQWGQRFSYTLTQVGTAEPAPEGVSIAWVDVFNPVRQELDVTGPKSGELWFSDRPGKAFTASSIVPARYTNRDKSLGRDYELDGYYYLRIDADLAESPSTAQFVITVDVTGDVEAGPVYQPAGGVGTGGGTTASTTSTSTSTGTSSSAGSSDDTASSADASTGSGVGSTGGDPSSSISSAPSTRSDVANTADVRDSGGGLGTPVWIGIGVAVIAAIGLVIWLTTRRRPAAPPASHW